MQNIKEPGGENSKCKGPEVRKILSILRLLRKTSRIGCRNKLVTGMGTGGFGMGWAKPGEIGSTLVEDYVLGRDVRMRSHCWI